MEKITIYTRLNCAKCEAAYQMLVNLAVDRPLEIDVIDITHDYHQGHFDRYRARIPLLARPQVARELDWPFTAQEVIEFLNA